VYEVIDTVNFDSLSVSIDPNSNPAIRPYRYKVGFIDTLARVFPPSDFHQTIHLTISQGAGDTWNLIWTAYAGFDYSSYRILRKSDAGSYQQIATVSASFNSYTDFSAPPGDVSYIVEVVSPGCDPASRDSGYGSVYSNIASNSLVSVPESLVEGFKVFPNPAKDRIHLSFGQGGSGPISVRISDLSGRTVLEMEAGSVLTGMDMSISTTGMPNGMYILRGTSDERVSAHKIQIRR
jgi:hypothetical protein